MPLGEGEGTGRDVRPAHHTGGLRISGHDAQCRAAGDDDDDVAIAPVRKQTGEIAGEGDNGRCPDPSRRECVCLGGKVLRICRV